MFLKRPERRKNGKDHTYRALVESERRAGGSRHRVVAYLGELKKSEQNGWAALGRRLDRRQRPQPSPFDLPRYDELGDDEPRGAGLADAPRTLLDAIARIKSGDVVLKAQSADGRDHAIRVRCVTTPDKPQKVLLNRLGLTLPRRLRYFEEITPMESRLLTKIGPGHGKKADSTRNVFNLG